MRDLFYDILNMGLWGEKSRTMGFSMSESQADVLFEMGRLQAVGGLIIAGMEEMGIIIDGNYDKWKNLLINFEKKNSKMEGLAHRIISDLTSWGIKAEVFKGTSVGRWYRNPSVRNYGDIDIVVSEGMERIAGILEDKKIYFENHHDDIFCKIGGFYVEFHPQREY